MLTLLRESNHFIRSYNQQGEFKILEPTGENIRNDTVIQGGVNILYELFQKKKMG